MKGLRFELSKWKASQTKKIDPSKEEQTAVLRVWTLSSEGKEQRDRFLLRKLDYAIQEENGKRFLRIDLLHPKSFDALQSLRIFVRKNTLNGFFAPMFEWLDEYHKQTKCGEFAVRFLLALVALEIIMDSAPVERFNQCRVVDLMARKFSEELRNASRHLQLHRFYSENPGDCWAKMPKPIKATLMKVLEQESAICQALTQIGFEIKRVKVDGEDISATLERKGIDRVPLSQIN